MKIISREDAETQNLKRYFTGESCERGHTVERFACNGACIECNKLRLRRARRLAKDKTK